MTISFPLFLTLPIRKPKFRGPFRLGRVMWGLGIGGVAAACAALVTYRVRARRQGNSAMTPAFPSSRDTAPEIASQAWASGGAPMENLIPAAYSVPDPTLPEASDSGTEPSAALWMDSLRSAMEKKPLQSGFDKSVWTAPLLAEYLMKTHGITVPVPRIRSALKELGYHWKSTHYATARNGTRQDP